MVVPLDVGEQPTSTDADLLKEFQERTYVEELKAVVGEVDSQRLVPDLAAGSSEVEIAPSDGISVEWLRESGVATNERGLHEDEGIDIVANLAWEAEEIEALVVGDSSCVCAFAVDD